MRMRKEKLTVPVMLSLFVLAAAVSGAARSESAGGTIEYGTKEVDVVTITISKEYMDSFDEVYGGPFGELAGLMQTGDEDEVLETLLVSEIEDYGITEEGDVYYVLTEDVYQEFQEEWRQVLVSSIQSGIAKYGYHTCVHYNMNENGGLTMIQMEVAEEDYQDIISENRKLLYSIRLGADVYQAMTGTSDNPVTVEVTDIATGELLDDADWYDWFEGRAEIESEEAAKEAAGEDGETENRADSKAENKTGN